MPLSFVEKIKDHVAKTVHKHYEGKWVRWEHLPDTVQAHLTKQGIHTLDLHDISQPLKPLTDVLEDQPLVSYSPMTGTTLHAKGLADLSTVEMAGLVQTFVEVCKNDPMLLNTVQSLFGGEDFAFVNSLSEVIQPESIPVGVAIEALSKQGYMPSGLETKQYSGELATAVLTFTMLDPKVGTAASHQMITKLSAAVSKVKGD